MPSGNPAFLILDKKAVHEACYQMDFRMCLLVISLLALYFIGRHLPTSGVSTILSPIHGTCGIRPQRVMISEFNFQHHSGLHSGLTRFSNHFHHV